jgi:hypothetical protein
LEALKTRGARSLGGAPWSQEDDQKEALAPLPMDTSGRIEEVPVGGGVGGFSAHPRF